MADEAIRLYEIAALIRRNIKLYLGICIMTTALAVALTYYLPKKYKAKAVLNVQSSYFQNPLVNDLISEVYDPSEQTAQRLSLLRLSLTEDFLDYLGNKYKIYKYSPTNPLRPLERELMLKRIEYFSVSRNTFQVSVISERPRMAYLMAEEIVDQMKETIFRERQKKLLRTRDALQENVASLSAAIKGVTAPLTSLQQSLKAELEEITTKIRALEAQFTEAHPEVLRLRKKKESLRQLLKQAQLQSPLTGALSGTPKEYLSPSSKEPTQEAYNELVKKLTYMNIVLALEKDKETVSYLSLVEKPSVPSVPFFPRKKVFLLLGLVAGNLLAAIAVVYMEMRRGTFLSPEHASDLLEIPHFGQLPKLADQSSLRLIEGPSKRAVRQVLPAPYAAE